MTIRNQNKTGINLIKKIKDDKENGTGNVEEEYLEETEETQEYEEYENSEDWIDERELTPEYQKFVDLRDIFFADLDENGILTRADFTCCRTCGASDMRILMTVYYEEDIIYDGFMFYHDQTKDSIVESIANGKKEIDFYMSWAYNESLYEEQQFIETVKNIAKEHNIEAECYDISTNFHITINI